ncbi:PspA/IM30 family protein [Pontibacter sp. BT310]|uniref:PspA/IM30 family protein n=1 Tax=Pontibacter populi TaxID=890055 RepID=A0ABS6XAI0_9BACT|nr:MULTISPECIES: PspA/IM30 family protein [Pontibacter]MBJ6118116.1 PspA/IM30 family protein [Pontibacter sp. BT310]MBR0570543.1 PspA/IM30 family protein [Microvirga sp. STS03]MBW3364969.1 PspA/IM30 family protein [Pontibacter populi]
MNIFKRIFKIGQAETHSAIDQLENPIKMSEQGIRDMKEDLDKSLRALAEVKAMAIRARNDVENYREKAQEYENKAVQLLQRAHKGDLSTTEADRLAGEALLRKEENIKLSAQALQDQHKFEGSVAQLDQNIKQLKSTISKWENELKTLKSRVTVSNATKTINKQLAQIDSHSTVALLERMKEKVAVEEALAESYGEIANESKTIDQEIDKALQTSAASKASEDVAALKAKLGLTTTPVEGRQE